MEGIGFCFEVFSSEDCINRGGVENIKFGSKNGKGVGVVGDLVGVSTFVFTPFL